MSTTLMKIPDVNEVFTDGFLIDDTGTIAFLSLIGKDTAIQEFRARWSLPVTQGGLTDFQVAAPDGAVRLALGNPESLEFLSGRLQTKLFGNLIQVFVYKKIAQKPDFANRKALQMFKRIDKVRDVETKLWVLIKNLSPLPLLDEWKDVIFSLFKEKIWLQELPGMGEISAHQVTIPEDEFAHLLKANILSGALSAEANADGLYIDSKKKVFDQPQCLTHLKSELDETVNKLSNQASQGKKSNDFWADAQVIDSYTRAEAIADGFLVDVSNSSEAKESGFVVSVALTSNVWSNYVEWPKDKSGQDEKGRLWDVLYMASIAMRSSKKESETLLYKLFCVPSASDSLTAKEVTLKIHSGPGDNGEHVITIMKPDES